MTSAIIILLCLVIFIQFAIYDKVNIKQKEQDTQSNDLEIFRQGARQNWITINVCLFKMWNELDILDFESIQNKLQETIQELTNDPKKLDEWGKKFNDYFKEQQ